MDTLRVALQQHMSEEARLRDVLTYQQTQMAQIQSDLARSAQRTEVLSDEVSRQHQLLAKGKQHVTSLMDEVASLHHKLQHAKDEQDAARVRLLRLSRNLVSQQ